MKISFKMIVESGVQSNAKKYMVSSFQGLLESSEFLMTSKTPSYTAHPIAELKTFRVRRIEAPSKNPLRPR